MLRLVVAALAGAALLACEPAPTEPTRAALATLTATAGAPTEQDALDISRNIQALHVPYGTVIDPVFASADPADPAGYTRLEQYTRAGDAAIWTGHYLAAEAFRYHVTGSAEALANAKRAVAAIADLVAVTSPAQPDLLARFFIPTGSPYAASIMQGEAERHGQYTSTLRGEEYYWLGNTSRDQYSGVFFGLGVAYDMVGDGALRAKVRRTVTRMLDFLLRNNWNVVMPDGEPSTTFLHRPDMQLTFLQVGRRVNPDRFEATYLAYRTAHAANVAAPIQTECLDPHGSYYKFNLDHINLYNLIRLEDSPVYRALYLNAFSILRGCTGQHQNAHFNMVARAVAGADAARDAETAELLGLWLARPRRDYYKDLRDDGYTWCGPDPDQACQIIAVDDRVNTDFLWQRSPFQLYGGRDGRTETAAIDYILPYWMARYYGVLPAPL